MGEERLGEIGRELRRLRVAAGLSGVGLAARAGVPQPTVSRVETGRRVSDPDVVVRLFGALGLAPGEVERLAGLVRGAYAQSASRRSDAGVSFRAGGDTELAERARTVCGFGAVVVPRLLRTVEYAAASGDSGGAVSGLDGAGRRLSFMVGEAALRTWPGAAESMVGQLSYLAEVCGRGDVRLGVVPAGAVPRALLHGFVIYDDAAVTVETFTREVTFTDADEVAAYVEVFEGFERAAVYGEAARALVQDAARDLRKTLGFIH